MLFWIGYIVGAFIGCLITGLITNLPVGTICVYENDDGGGEPYIFLVLESDVRCLFNRNKATLKIERRQNPAQK